MPVFEIQTQDGKTFQVDAPDQQSAYAALEHHTGPQVGTGEDMLRSGAAGVGQGVVGMAGLPGDFREAVNSVDPAFQSLKARLGFGSQPPEPVQGIPDVFKTSGELQGMANDATRPAPNVHGLVTGQQPKSFMEYEPKTTAGKYARTAGQFAPGMAMGPGSAAVKGAAWLGGSLASEAAGQATEGTKLEPYARTAAAVLGGGGPAALVQRLGRGSAIPSTQQFGAAKNAAYARAKASGNTLPAQDYADTVDALGDLAVRSGAHETLTPRVVAALKELDANVGQDLSVEQIDQMRQVLKMGEDVMKPQERYLIRRLVSEYDKRVDRAVPPELKEARRLNVRYKKSELMDEIRDNAELKTGQYSQSGAENATRTMFRQLAMNKRKMRQFDAGEREAIRTVAKGTKPANAARRLGKLAPTSAMSFMPGASIGSTAALLTGDPVLGTAIGTGIMAAGAGGKVAAGALTNRSARIAEELIRGGKRGAATAQAMRGEKRLEAIVRALLTTESASVPTRGR